MPIWFNKAGKALVRLFNSIKDRHIIKSIYGIQNSFYLAELGAKFRSFLILIINFIEFILTFIYIDLLTAFSAMSDSYLNV